MLSSTGATGMQSPHGQSVSAVHWAPVPAAVLGLQGMIFNLRIVLCFPQKLPAGPASRQPLQPDSQGSQRPRPPSRHL